MNGQEHFTEAERLIAVAAGGNVSEEYAEMVLAGAQVHATLALAKATLAISNRVPAEFWGGRDEPAPED